MAAAFAVIMVHTRFIRLSQDKPVECRSRTCIVWRAEQGAGRRQQIWIFRTILEKGRPGSRWDFDGRTGLQGMIECGWRTAPPQVDSEARLVTNSACRFPSEATSRGSESFLVLWVRPVVGRGRSAASSGAADRAALLGARWTQPARSGLTSLAAAWPPFGRRSFSSRILSASSVKSA
jgi:hypothetical protein